MCLQLFAGACNHLYTLAMHACVCTVAYLHMQHVRACNTCMCILAYLHRLAPRACPRLHSCTHVCMLAYLDTLATHACACSQTLATRACLHICTHLQHMHVHARTLARTCNTYMCTLAHTCSMYRLAHLHTLAGRVSCRHTCLWPHTHACGCTPACRLPPVVGSRAPHARPLLCAPPLNGCRLIAAAPGRALTAPGR